MRNYKISLVFISVLIISCFSLPVKETSSSTEKPNDHKKDNDDSPTHNLENIIGEYEKYFLIFLGNSKIFNELGVILMIMISISFFDPIKKFSV